MILDDQHEYWTLRHVFFFFSFRKPQPFWLTCVWGQYSSTQHVAWVFLCFGFFKPKSQNLPSKGQTCFFSVHFYTEPFLSSVFSYLPRVICSVHHALFNLTISYSPVSKLWVVLLNKKKKKRFVYSLLDAQGRRTEKKNTIKLLAEVCAIFKSFSRNSKICLHFHSGWRGGTCYFILISTKMSVYLNAICICS